MSYYLGQYLVGQMFVHNRTGNIVLLFRQTRPDFWWVKDIYPKYRPLARVYVHTHDLRREYEQL